MTNTRLRRNRSHRWLRNLNCEHHLSTDDLILPLFIHGQEGVYQPIKGLSDIKRHSIAAVLSVIEEAQNLGINAIALFPVVDGHLKSDDAVEAYNPENLLCRAIRSIKRHFPDIGIIADVALDPYTTHGHDGIVKDGIIENDQTVSILSKQAVVLAAAGCDVIAPSDMMDGRVQEIRRFLNGCNFHNVAILSYAAKYCSSFYGPFRQVVSTKISATTIDKSTYQMAVANRREAMREIQLDIDEGADMVMIKPGLPYLDVIKAAYDRFDIPIFAYQVSGEFAMLKAASNNGWLDYEQAIHESLLCFKRAGAYAIITYAALDVARMIK